LPIDEQKEKPVRIHNSFSQVSSANLGELRGNWEMFEIQIVLEELYRFGGLGFPNIECGLYFMK
jgi:hypothetical protein